MFRVSRDDMIGDAETIDGAREIVRGKKAWTLPRR
jgi:hypothetical protein